MCFDKKNLKTIIPFIPVYVMLGLALFGVSLLFTGTLDPYHAMSCGSIDYVLSSNLVGDIELNDSNYERLMDGMNWCMEQGFEPQPISEFER